jgi:hypothetical protein
MQFDSCRYGQRPELKDLKKKCKNITHLTSKQINFLWRYFFFILKQDCTQGGDGYVEISGVQIAPHKAFTVD